MRDRSCTTWRLSAGATAILRVVRNRHVLVACAIVVAALLTLAIIGVRVLARDRQRIQREFGLDKLELLDRTASGLGNDVGEIGEDLELAGALLERAVNVEIADRELHAIATIKREYLAMEASVLGHDPLRAIALDAPEDILEQVAAITNETIETARRRPSTLVVSGPLGASGDATWRRVFARTSAADAPVIAVIVDLRPLLDRLRLLRDGNSALLVLGAHGNPAPASDAAIAAVAADPVRLAGFAGLDRLLAGTAERRPTTVAIDESEARRLGLPASTAVGVAVPVLIEDGEPWGLVLISSTVALRTQERTLVARLALGGGIAATLIIGLAVYFVVNSRRAAALRERLRHAHRLAHLTEKAEKILDNIPSGVLALGEDGRVTSTNRWFDERLGRSCVGETIAAVFPRAPAGELALLETLAASARADAGPCSRHRIRLTEFGPDALFNVHAVPMQRRLVDVVGLLVFEDLTPIRRIEEQLVHSEKLATAGQLAAGIAHEIGTPLNIARGRAELVLAKAGQDPATADSQRLIIDQIDLVSDQIRQLLDYVRPARSEIQPIDTPGALRRARDLLASEAAKRRVELTVDAWR
jgi:two-component system sensor histidine kinase HydH